MDATNIALSDHSWLYNYFFQKQVIINYYSESITWHLIAQYSQKQIILLTLTTYPHCRNPSSDGAVIHHSTQSFYRKHRISKPTENGIPKHSVVKRYTAS